LSGRRNWAERIKFERRLRNYSQLRITPNGSLIASMQAPGPVVRPFSLRYACRMSQDFSRFFRPGRVHRSIYTDPGIFELEMAHIFGKAWIYIGHESQIKNPGDYFATQMGRRPVVMVRDEQGKVRVIHNQCAHRGAMVVATDKGNAPEFTCCYHGWTYHLDGRIKAVPLNHGYPQDFDAKDPRVAMLPVKRVQSHRGFVFASDTADGPTLEESLGHIATSLDDMVDRAPDGEIEAAGGVFKHAYDANWKIYFENLCDAAHPIFTHRSSIEASQAQSDDVYSDGTGEIAIRQMRQNGAPYSFWESQVGIWTYPNGHSYLGDYHDDSKLVAALKDPVFREYIAALEKKKGKDETKRILEVRRWNSNIYPNVSLMSQFQQLRVVHPIAVNRTVVHTYNFRLKGAPEQMFRNTIAFANIVNGTGSLVLTDDLEIYNRIDLGLSSEGASWLQIGRGYRSDQPDTHGGRKGVNSTSEVYIRNMFEAWQGYMNDGQDGARAARAAS
jgi:phenylpropionate dioxygenase-like ring-hydroxylating dioxygenase large terminal subunit